jgi:outer membrane protein
MCALTLCLAVALLACCQRPWDSHAPHPSLERIIEESLAAELAPAPAAAQAPSDGAPPEPAPAAEDAQAASGPRQAELDALSPLPPDRPIRADVGVDLTGNAAQSVEVSLSAAIQSAVNRNLAIQSSRLQPSITAEELLAAQAIFDVVLFANADLAWTDQPQRTPVIMGFPLGTPFSRSQTYRFETGVRKPFETGTELFVSTDLTRFRNMAPGITFFPDPAYTATMRAGVNQPLMRGFGTSVNTATIRVARNQRDRSTQQYELDLLNLVARTEQAYWELDAAWRELAIAEWLVQVGEEVREIMARRQEFDTRPAQYSDAVARVEQRQADVIRARRTVRAASDALKALLNDPQMPLSAEAVIKPLEAPSQLPIAFDLREALTTAVDASNGRPEIRQAALDIDDATIRQIVADNQRLPLLDLTAQAAFYGLDDDFGGAYSEAGGGDFIDYLLGVIFEWPIGNRAGGANYRAARLRRSAATINYQRTAQDVILDVKNSLRDVVTNWELIAATRSFRVAQAENLRTLLVEEEFLAGLTPEFLNLKFQRQETLAQARREEIRAIADFNQSVAALYRAMGTGLRMRHIAVELE